MRALHDTRHGHAPPERRAASAGPARPRLRIAASSDVTCVCVCVCMDGNVCRSGSRLRSRYVISRPEIARALARASSVVQLRGGLEALADGGGRWENLHVVRSRARAQSSSFAEALRRSLIEAPDGRIFTSYIFVSRLEIAGGDLAREVAGRRSRGRSRGGHVGYLREISGRSQGGHAGDCARARSRRACP